MMELTFALDQIRDVARKIIENTNHKVIVFNGEMGAGKTTLIKAVSSELGVEGNTSSPTFSLVNEYRAANGMIYHFDMYRLKSQSEALDMGIEEYLYSGHWCFVEWAEKIAGLIPENHSTVEIIILPDGRRQISIKN